VWDLCTYQSYDHAAMQRADLSNQDLEFVIFAACDCRQINLSGSNCNGSTDTFANFELANLENSSWRRVRGVPYVPSPAPKTLREQQRYAPDTVSAALEVHRSSRACSLVTSYSI
jgi:uncharacterized protein YjbI with pentapeptide repeats